MHQLTMVKWPAVHLTHSLVTLHREERSGAGPAESGTKAHTFSSTQVLLILLPKSGLKHFSHPCFVLLRTITTKRQFLSLLGEIALSYEVWAGQKLKF